MVKTPINFIFESDKDSTNGSPRNSYRGPLHNLILDAVRKLPVFYSYTENLEVKTECLNILFFEVNRAEMEIKRIAKLYKNWIIENNVNIILANIADPTNQDIYESSQNRLEKCGLKDWTHWIDTNNRLKDMGAHTFDYFIEEIINHQNVMGNLFNHGEKNELGYVSTDIDENDLDNFRNKKFLSFNRVLTPKYHRSKLFLDYNLYNLGEESSFSFLEYERIRGYGGWNWISEFKETNEYTLELIEKSIDLLPIQLDTKNWNDNRHIDNPITGFQTSNTFKSELFLDSCINIVTETSFQFNELFVSEKILKPIIMYQPFIVFSGYGYLKYLREIGFKTFGDFWDESYDDIEDFEKRYQKIISLILELNMKSIDELNDLYKSVKDICIYNRKHLFKIMEKIEKNFHKVRTNKNNKQLI